jgi:hypothetical protein
MKIKLNDQEITIDSELGRSNGADVRAKLPGALADHNLFRQASGGTDDFIGWDSEIFDGDILYSVPPCHGS